MEVDLNYLNKFQQKTKKQPKHEKAYLVNEIIKTVGESEKYNYGYWLGRLKQFEKKAPITTIYRFLREIKDLPEKYNKGGALTNKIKDYGVNKNKD